jgi:hypothetical protein
MDDRSNSELAGYDPDDQRPVRHPATHHAMRIVVILGIVALVLPGIIISISTANNTAQQACRAVVIERAPDSVAYSPRFELAGAEGPGWYCYAQQFDGTEILVGSLGLIPQSRYAPVDDDSVPA